jgi:hypothetical protein
VTEPARFQVMRSANVRGSEPPLFSVLPAGSSRALATGMSRATADDVAGALALAVDANGLDRAGAAAIREHLDASGRVGVGPADGRDPGAFMATLADGCRFIVRVRLVDQVDPPRLLPPVPSSPSAPANTWGAWEIVGPDLRRTSVPGGWLYQVGSPSAPSTSPVFVPDPDVAERLAALARDAAVDVAQVSHRAR